MAFLSSDNFPWLQNISCPLKYFPTLKNVSRRSQSIPDSKNFPSHKNNSRLIIVGCLEPELDADELPGGVRAVRQQVRGQQRALRGLGRQRRVRQQPRVHEHLLRQGSGQHRHGGFYLTVVTLQACKKCKGSCDDEKKDCKTWANKGFCKSGKYVDYMSLRCKKSCNKC